MQIAMRSKKRCVQFSLVFAATLCVALAQDQQPETNTTFGPVRGVWLKTARGADVAGFLGLPYAQPPVGELRFENPQPWTEKWNETRNATSDGSMCVQITESEDVAGDEDCLFINVFTPTITKNQKITENKTLPVIIFIHGGSFNVGGNNSTFYSPKYLLDHGVVLVTMNYRLNVLGFFSTGNDITPGNYGLKDIALALRWIHDNVEDFGGDPNSVTLLGLSSGAASAHLLSASKATEGLFHKLITMSGSATAPWAFHTRENIRNSSMYVANILGCNNETIYFEESGSGYGENETTTINPKVLDDREADIRLVQCMKNASAYDIVKSGYFYAWRRNPVCIFGPTLEADTEGAILTVHPTQAPYRDMPWIAGVTDDEGLLKTADFFLTADIRTELLKDYDDYLVPYVLEMEDLVNNVTAATEAITDFYFKGDPSTYIDANITQMYGDAVVVWPMYDSLRKQTKNMKSNVYMYVFGYTGTFSNTFRYGIPFRFGVAHGDDLNYIFPYLNEKFADLQLFNTVGDTTMVNVMSEMWTNFAKTGEPSARLTTNWEPYGQQRRYMKFGNGMMTDLVMENDFVHERMAFWDEFAKNYAAPITEYRIGGSGGNGNNTGGNGNNTGGSGGKGGAGKGGVAEVRAGFVAVLLSVMLCWTISSSFLL